MKRRSLLKSIVAGSTTAMAPAAAILGRAALAQGNGAAPIRTLFIFHPNGCVPDIFFPTPGQTTLPAMTAPMQSVFEHCLFIDGIGYPGRAHTHEGGAAKCLTGYGGVVHSNGSQGLSSIEVLMGKADWANRDTTQITVPSVQMGVGTKWGDNVNKRISFDGNQDLHAVDDPVILYPQLFNSMGGGPGTNIGTEIMSVIRGDLTRLQTQLGSIERERLELHSDALSVLEARLRDASDNTNTDVCAGPDITPVGEGRNERLWLTNILETVSDVQQDLAVQALSCNLTRSIAFSYGVSVSPIVVPGTSSNDHDLSHQNAAAHTTSKIWWMAEIAKFIQKLANTPDVNGSLLDNTIICTVSDLGHGNRHDHYRIPMLLAGGKNTGLVGGRGVDFRPYGTPKVQGDQNENDPSINHTDVLTTVAERAGYNIEMPQTVGRIHNAWTGGVSP